MGHSDASGLGAIPNATGTLTRLAYEYAKAKGIECRPLLKRANLTLHQIKITSLRFNVCDQIKFLNLAATELHDDLLGFHLAHLPDLRKLGFLYYVAASSEVLGDALQRPARYASIVNEGLALKYIGGKSSCRDEKARLNSANCHCVDFDQNFGFGKAGHFYHRGRWRGF